MVNVRLSLYVKKAITWRVVASLITMVFLYWATGKVDVMLTFGAMEAFVKVVAYVVHERVWEDFARAQQRPNRRQSEKTRGMEDLEDAKGSIHVY